MAATVMFLWGCTTAPQLAYRAPPAGSKWTVVRTDSGSFGSTTAQVTTRRGDQLWKGERLITYESPGFTQLLRTDGRLVAFTDGNKPIVSFEPDLSMVYPLEVGKSATTEHKVTIYAANRVVPMQVVQKVEAYEDVTVPAGTFKAFRVSWTEDNGNENVYWVSTDLGIVVKSILTRTAKNAAGAGRRVTELVAYTAE